MSVLVSVNAYYWQLKKKEKKSFKSLNTVQGHSWSNPDDQKMLQALQNKPDKAYTFLIT